MYTRLKKEIEKEFSKETNYNTIISKVERTKGMNSKKLKYILAPTCALLIGVVGFIGLKNHLQREDILIDKVNVGQAKQEMQEEKEKDTININSYASNDIYDIDAKWIDTDLMQEFNFLNNIYIPEHLKETRQGKIYVRDGIDDDNYSKFNQYSIIFFDDSEPEDKSVSIDFSKEELLPDCTPSGIDSAQESIINNMKVKLFAVELKRDSTKIKGEAYFEYNDYKFDIQVYRITEDEFIQIVKSVITEIRVGNLPIEDRAIEVDEQPSEIINTGYPDFYGGKYVDENGNNVVLLCENNEDNRKEICSLLEITESKTIFKTAKYSYNYLVELQSKISEAMQNKELSFVTTSSLRDDTNNIKVTVTSNNESDLKKLKKLDSTGAIDIEYSVNSMPQKDLLVEEK